MQITYWTPSNSCWLATSAPSNGGTVPVVPPTDQQPQPAVNVAQPLPSITTPPPQAVVPAPAPQDCSAPTWWLSLIGVAVIAGFMSRRSG